MLSTRSITICWSTRVFTSIRISDGAVIQAGSFDLRVARSSRKGASPGLALAARLNASANCGIGCPIFLNFATSFDE